jgi:hypothetical protein
MKRKLKLHSFPNSSHELDAKIVSLELRAGEAFKHRAYQWSNLLIFSPIK